MAGEERSPRTGVRKQTLRDAAAFVLAEEVVRKGAPPASDPFDRIVDGAVKLVGPKHRMAQAARSRSPQARRQAREELAEVRRAQQTGQARQATPEQYDRAFRRVVARHLGQLAPAQRELAAQRAIEKHPERKELIQQALQEVESNEIHSLYSESDDYAPDAEYAWDVAELDNADEDYEVTAEERETWDNATDEQREMAMEAWLNEEEDA